MHYLCYKIIGEPKKYWLRPYSGLELTMHVHKSQIHLARQSV
jgi:hypothetical protein